MDSNRTFELSAFFRALFLIVSAAVLTAALCLPAMVSCFLDRSGHWPSFFQRLWVRWLLGANGIRLNLQGLENLQKDQAYILVSNHSSLLDIPGIISACPLPVRFMAKKSLTWVPVFGWLLYLAGHILINRESVRSALKSLKKASSLLRDGISIVVFPEGTRSPDGGVKEFKRGAFLLAQQAKFPIVPVSIGGSFKMLPRNGWCLWPGTLNIRMGKPISNRDPSPRASGNVMDQVRETIIQNLKT
jgi:1-acyl-sn-glycerol-3-phosphate acyltransferase